MSIITGRIQDFWHAYRREILFAVILFLASWLSFNLGYLANREMNRAPIIIEKCSEAAK